MLYAPIGLDCSKNGTTNLTSIPCFVFSVGKGLLVISAKLPDNILAHSPHFRRWDLSRRGGRGGTWW